MLDLIIKFSLKNRLTVIIFSILLLIYGGWVAMKLPVDVFPDLNRPIVTIMAESGGLAPEEVETLVTKPIETSLNGTPGLTRIRSSSGLGLAVIYAEFEWGSDPFKNRQLVSEKMQLVRDQLPDKIVPIMTPASSIMGEIMFVGVTSESKDVTPMELRTMADWILRPRLLAITGVAQVITMGGDLKQYQILVSSEKLQKRGFALEDLKHSLGEMGENATGGLLDIKGQEFLIRPMGRPQGLEDIFNSFVGTHQGNPVLVKDIAQVKIGHHVKRGNASVNGKHSVILTIQKQPSANTIELTKKIEEEIASLQKGMPEGVKIHSDLFKQANFIEHSIGNVKEALRDGAIMVMIVLLAFLMNVRTTAITLTAIPLSLVVTALIFKAFGLSVNTMTLGGLAVAIGELVDDAIVDVENVFRRLKENRLAKNPKSAIHVIYEASSEVRNSIVFSTIITVLVFIPLFAMEGIEGRLFAPLGMAYIISLLASLVISLTVTPALCSLLLPKSKAILSLDSAEHKHGPLVRFLSKHAEKIVRKALPKPWVVMSLCLLMVLGAMALIPLMGRNFLPAFNEGSATIGLAARPGISLSASDAIGIKVERELLKIPEIKSTVRRVGRAEMDEHAEGVHWNEIDVDFKEEGRPREIVLNEIRNTIQATAPGIFMNIGQPISHRLDHLLSGVRAQIAIKIFGQDMAILRKIAGEMIEKLEGTEGMVDLANEPLVLVPQLKMSLDRQSASEARMGVGTLAQDLEDLLNGVFVGKVIEGQQSFNIFMRLDENSRNSPDEIENVALKVLPSGNTVRVSDVAKVYKGSGPNMINREDMMRRIIVSANSSGRDLESLVGEIKNKISSVELPSGYFIKIGGQYEGQQKSTKLMIVLGLISLLGIFSVLFLHFGSATLSLQIMANVPLALVGSVLAVFITERVMSLATIVAFVTLCGIASRNGIMMITHYLHIMEHEGEEFSDQMIIRGTLERLVPVLMTALTAILALIPLLLAKGEPGKEILHPVAVVIVGGLLTSTLLDIIVTPVMFRKFGHSAALAYIAKKKHKE